jgi:hypothetical protein
MITPRKRDAFAGDCTTRNMLASTANYYLPIAPGAQYTPLESQDINVFKE